MEGSGVWESWFSPCEAQKGQRDLGGQKRGSQNWEGYRGEVPNWEWFRGTPKPGRGTPHEMGASVAVSPHPRFQPPKLQILPLKTPQIPLGAISPLFQAQVQNGEGAVGVLGFCGAALPRSPTRFWGGGAMPWHIGTPEAPSATAASASSSAGHGGVARGDTQTRETEVEGNTGGKGGPKWVGVRGEWGDLGAQRGLS